MLVDLEAYRLRVQSLQVKAVVTERRKADRPVLVERRLDRRAAQDAVGRLPLRDVLLSLRRAGLIRGFRLEATALVVKADRTLPFMFETCDLS
jgi:hypothetical protein